MLVTLIIALALVFFVMRPLLKRVLAPETTPLALAPSSEIGAGVGPLMAAAQAPMDESEAEPHQPPRVPAWMNNAKSMGEAQAQTLKTVGALVDENPKQAALIVREWLGNAA